MAGQGSNLYNSPSIKSQFAVGAVWHSQVLLSSFSVYILLSYAGEVEFHCLECGHFEIQASTKGKNLTTWAIRFSNPILSRRVFQCRTALEDRFFFQIEIKKLELESKSHKNQDFLNVNIRVYFPFLVTTYYDDIY